MRRTRGPLLGLRGAPRTRPRLATTDMGSVGPHGVSTPSGHSRAGSVGRIAPSSGPPCAFASLQRPIATPPHRRGDPEGPARPTMLPSLGFRAPRHMPERGTRNPRSLPAPRRAACEVWVPPSRRPPPSLRAPLRAPERPRASRFEAFSSRRSDPLSGVLCPPAVGRVDSPRSLRCVRTRPASGPRSRRRIRAVLRALAGPERRCLLAIPPFRALSPTVLSGALVRARSPTTRWAG